MANYMREIAELLGVELGDIFKVANINNNIKNENYFRLTKKALRFHVAVTIGGEVLHHLYLQEL